MKVRRYFVSLAYPEPTCRPNKLGDTEYGIKDPTRRVLRYRE